MRPSPMYSVETSAWMFSPSNLAPLASVSARTERMHGAEHAPHVGLALQVAIGDRMGLCNSNRSRGGLFLLGPLLPTSDGQGWRGHGPPRRLRIVSRRICRAEFGARVSLLFPARAAAIRRARIDAPHAPTGNVRAALLLDHLLDEKALAGLHLLGRDLLLDDRRDIHTAVGRERVIVLIAPALRAFGELAAAREFERHFNRLVGFENDLIARHGRLRAGRAR